MAATHCVFATCLGCLGPNPKINPIIRGHAHEESKLCTLSTGNWKPKSFEPKGPLAVLVAETSGLERCNSVNLNPKPHVSLCPSFYVSVHFASLILFALNLLNPHVHVLVQRLKVPNGHDFFSTTVQSPLPRYT